MQSTVTKLKTHYCTQHIMHIHMAKLELNFKGLVNTSDVVPRGTASSRGSLESEFSLPRPRPLSRPLMSWPWPRSRLICLGLATASRHQFQGSRFYFYSLLHLLK